MLRRQLLLKGSWGGQREGFGFRGTLNPKPFGVCNSGPQLGCLLSGADPAKASSSLDGYDLMRAEQET